ncbi:MAG TPA: sigma-54 dependent transcriptional regulator [Nitrospiraceae bacterium]|nr:sigma-54 dependent transcriptional regulator [Nitrospiraceae bacterium]
MPKTSLLIVEDYEPFVTLLRSTLSDEFDVTVADSVDKASALINREVPRLVLLDLGLPPTSSPEQGLALLKEIRREGHRCKTVVCTGYRERELALRAVRYGAYDVLYKPLDLAMLKGVLMRAGWLADLEEEARHSVVETTQESEIVDEIFSASLSMRSVQDAVEKLAKTDAAVLITGESGTGRELVARAIHGRSERAAGPFVPVACGALPRPLFEQELFGQKLPDGASETLHENGKLALARGGTLFFDELADLPADTQWAVLRVMERMQGANVRILASWNKSPHMGHEPSLIEADVYRRFAARIAVPPLRDRGDDVVVLGKIFLRRFAAQQNKPLTGFTTDAIDAMRAYSWPGNVRELATRIQRGIVVSDGPHLNAADLDLHADSSEEDSISLKVNQQRIETNLILKAFTLSRGNLSRAAQELGISRSTLYRRIRQYGLDRTTDAGVS